MSAVDVTVGEESTHDPGPVKKFGRPILGVRDLGVPVLCALLLLGLYLYVQSQNPQGILATVISMENIKVQTIEHLMAAVAIAAIVIAVAVPLGVVVTRKRTRVLAAPTLIFGNIGQAAPSLGLMALMGLLTTGYWAVVLILSAYAMLSVLRNTIVGLEGVDQNTLDAARGQGMSPMGILFKVELPLAIPVIAAGARTALTLAIATIPIGEYIGWGGLGEMLIGAYKNNRPLGMVVAAVLIAVLALLIDWLAGIIERALTPRGIR